MPYGEWRTWPRGEQQAIEVFWTAHWQYFLTQADAPGFAETWLNGLAILFPTIEPYLAFWQQAMADSPTARRRLADWLCQSPPMGRKPPTFWEECAAQWAEIQSWLRAERTSPLVRQALTEYSGAPPGAAYAYMLEEYDVWLDG